MPEAPKEKNQSEILFETYLKAHGITEWDYEPQVEGKSHRLDYRIPHHGQPYFYDVKEFRASAIELALLHEAPAPPPATDSQEASDPPPMTLPNGGAFDPYEPIRKKIHGVREQFSEYKEFPCSLVLFNIDAGLVRLDDWSIVMGAMLGDVGIRFSVDTAIGAAVGDFTQRFTNRGKMINYRHMKPQNTTISALIALENFPIGARRLDCSFKRKERTSGRKLTWEEFLQFAESQKAVGIDASQTALRAIVYENPYARIPLPRELFTGPCDERFGPDGDHITRLFAGPAILQIEAEEAALKS